jgi:uncharacterized protein (DUF2062 family)
VSQQGRPEKAGGKRRRRAKLRFLESQENEDRKHRRPQGRRQLGLLLEKDDAGRERERSKGHRRINAPAQNRLTVPRKFLRKYLPDPHTVRRHRLVSPFSAWLHHPNLWHLNRRSVPGAVAIGLACGLIPGPLQMLGALALAIPFRKNLPVALLMTLYTNPFTIVPLYLLAFGYGQLLLGASQSAVTVEPFLWDWSDFAGSLRARWEWIFALGRPLAVGLAALALTLAAAGYAATELAWRAYVVMAWRARARRRRGR